MAMPLPIVPTTADELEAIPEDGNRYEIIDGELFVSPAPSRSHQRALMLLALRLAPYAQELGLELLPAPTDVRASHKTQVQPDLLVLPRHFDGRNDTRWEQMSRLLLAVEILSPSTAHLDRVLKRRTYLSNGVREYWVMDLDARSIDVWLSGLHTPRVHTDHIDWTPLSDRPPLSIDLVRFFADIHRDA